MFIAAHGVEPFTKHTWHALLHYMRFRVFESPRAGLCQHGGHHHVVALEEGMEDPGRSRQGS